MSTPPVSPRTIVRDTIIAVLDSRRASSGVRVPAFNTSKKYLNAQETTKGNTYCVIVGDESREPHTQRNQLWKMQVKVVCYANHHDDPHSIIDGMIEDLHEAMGIVRDHVTLHGIVFNIHPGDITSDERTTEAGPWGQAVCTWTMDHTRH